MIHVFLYGLILAPLRDCVLIGFLGLNLWAFGAIQSAFFSICFHLFLTSNPRRSNSSSQSMRSFSGFNLIVFSAITQEVFSRVNRIRFFFFHRQVSEQNFSCFPESSFPQMRQYIDFRVPCFISLCIETFCPEGIFL